MALLKWDIDFQRLDLKYTWAISRNASDFKINAFVKVTDGEYTGVGEAAPNVRYGESQEAFEKVFHNLRFPSKPCPVHEISTWLALEKVPNALRFGIESAYVHYICAQKKVSVPQFLGLESPSTRNTAYTIPIMPIEKIGSYFLEYDLKRFSYIKLKINEHNLVPLATTIGSLTSAPLIIDANEAYKDPDVFLKDLEAIRKHKIEFLEQPFPANMSLEYEYLKKHSPFPVFADESITDQADFDKIERCFHGINMKLMKAGGYLQGVQLLQESQKRGLSTMIGCMVESSLGISSGYFLSSLARYLDLDSFLILQQDPFDLIKERNGQLFLNDNQFTA